jgi:isopropylmalate/homocitrate/citramalate synthase
MPYLPSLVGQKPVEIVIGKGSGVDSIDYWVKRIGMNASPQQVEELTRQVKERGMEKKGLLNEEEFTQLAQTYLKN